MLLAAGSTNFDNDLGKVQWMVRIAESSSNLAPKLGHPILSKNFFKYSSSGNQIVAFYKDFYKSLIWSVLTDNVSSSVLNSIKQQSFISPTLTTTGFSPEYAMYKQIFEEVHMSPNNFVRIIKINWNAAQKLAGVTKN